MAISSPDMTQRVGLLTITPIGGILHLAFTSLILTNFREIIRDEKAHPAVNDDIISIGCLFK
jgi:hypothetical protein